MGVGRELSEGAVASARVRFRPPKLGRTRGGGVTARRRLVLCAGCARRSRLGVPRWPRAEAARASLPPPEGGCPGSDSTGSSDLASSFIESEPSRVALHLSRRAADRRSWTSSCALSAVSVRVGVILSLPQRGDPGYRAPPGRRRFEDLPAVARSAFHDEAQRAAQRLARHLARLGARVEPPAALAQSPESTSCPSRRRIAARVRGAEG